MVSRVAFATGSRADYGIMRRLLALMDRDDEIELDVLVTGALLDEKYGHQVDLIRRDGFNIKTEIEIPLDSNSNDKIIHSMAVALDGFGSFFADNKYDLLIILGDRYEMLSVAEAAAMQQIPILHIHGGEATYANYDEFIRHAITKMSLYHFASTEEYRKRIIQLGEAPDRVFNLGALGAENCLIIDQANIPDDIKKLTRVNYFVVLFHPETLANVDAAKQTANLLSAISDFVNRYHFVFIGSNADTDSYKIRNAVKNFVAKNDNAIYYESLHPDAYHYLVKNSICLIGNSSSGIIEAPSLGVHTINIGHRQDGRVQGSSVINVACEEKEIINAMQIAIARRDEKVDDNPYYKENTANEYYVTIKQLLKNSNKDIAKTFYDL